MIITNDSIFLHLYKTGGNYIKEVLKKNKVSIIFQKSHLPYHKIPEKHLNKKIFGVIRNPWDWYVSYYYYCMKINNPKLAGGDLFLEISNEYKLDFNDTISNLFTIDYTKYDEFYRKNEISYNKIGLMSNLSKFFLNDFNNIKIIKLEEINKSLKEMGYNLIDEKINRSNRKHYNEYYSDDLIDKVIKYDSEVIEKFNYKFKRK
jgi:hypothetical protein